MELMMTNSMEINYIIKKTNHTYIHKFYTAFPICANPILLSSQIRILSKKEKEKCNVTYWTVHAVANKHDSRE